MNDTLPSLRRDLEFFPVQHGGQRLILIKDHLGLVQEGKAVAASLFQVMALLDGTRTSRDLQMEIMRQQGGVLVGTEEIRSLLAQLDESYFLDSENFERAKDQIVNDFAKKKIRPCSHCGHAYPAAPRELRERLNAILESGTEIQGPEGEIKALISPHIDLSIGGRVYANAYQRLRYAVTGLVIVLGVGHRMMGPLFCLTEKDFETPLGIVKTEVSLVQELKEAGRGLVADNDFPHRSEHSIEFQLLFLQQIWEGRPFTIIPILCGSVGTSLKAYSREAYLEEAGPFLKAVKGILAGRESTLLLAGVDFSHIGSKFGHNMPASYLETRSESHDRNLMGHLGRLDADGFWEESTRVMDQFNVCGFSALACLLEVLPPCKGHILDYDIWHESATQSAVSFAAILFTKT